MDAGFKPYPTCRWFHNGIVLLEGIIKEHDLKPDDIDRIVVNTHPLGITLPTYVAADKWAESNCKELWFSQFSLTYALACTVYGIVPGPEWAKEETLNNPKVLEMTGRIVHGEHPDAIRMTATWSGHPGKLFSQPPVSIEVFSRKGNLNAESTDIPGDSWNPKARLTDADIFKKFKNNASYVINDTQINKIIEAVENLDKIENIRDLVDLLVS